MNALVKSAVILFFGTLFFSLATPLDSSANTTINYSGLIQWSGGPLDSLFTAGTPIFGSLVFDGSTTDSNPADTNEGRYNNALISLTSNIPGVGSWSATQGSLSVFNDLSSPAITPDQFFANSYMGNAVGTSLNGQPINSLGIGFFPYPSNNMLSGDGLPGSSLNWDYGNIYFGFVPQTGASPEYTTVGFARQEYAVPEPTSLLLIGTGLLGLTGLKRRRKS
jgi:hypothetical protein